MDETRRQAGTAFRYLLFSRSVPVPHNLRLHHWIRPTICDASYVFICISALSYVERGALCPDLYQKSDTTKERHNERATKRKQFQKSDMNIAELTLLGVIRS